MNYSLSFENFGIMENNQESGEKVGLEQGNNGIIIISSIFHYNI